MALHFSMSFWGDTGIKARYCPEYQWCPQMSCGQSQLLSPISEEVGKSPCTAHQGMRPAVLRAKRLRVSHPCGCCRLLALFSERLHSCFPRNSTWRLSYSSEPHLETNTLPSQGSPSSARSWLLLTLYSSFSQQEI